MAKPKKTEYTIDECYLMMFSEYEDVVTAQEAAGMLRLPLKRVYRMFRAGELKRNCRQQPFHPPRSPFCTRKNNIPHIYIVVNTLLFLLADVCSL